VWNEPRFRKANRFVQFYGLHDHADTRPLSSTGRTQPEVGVCKSVDLWRRQRARVSASKTAPSVACGRSQNARLIVAPFCGRAPWLMYLAETGAMAVATLMIGTFGAVPLAGNQVAQERGAGNDAALRPIDRRSSRWRQRCSSSLPSAR
jgi:hypothetical protein